MAPNMKDEQIVALLTDREFIGEKPDETWPNFYARHMREQFASR